MRLRRLYYEHQQELCEEIAENLGQENRADVIDYLGVESEKEQNYYFASIDGLDSKASILIGFLGALLAIVGAMTFKKAPFPIKAFGFTAICFFVVAVGLAVFTFWPRKIMRAPGLSYLITEYQERELSFMKKNVIYYQTVDFYKYEKLLVLKGRLISWALVSGSLGILCLTISVGWKIAKGL